MDHDSGRLRERLTRDSIGGRLMIAFVAMVLFPVIAATGASVSVGLRGGSQQAFAQLETVATLKERAIAAWALELQLALKSEVEDDTAPSPLAEVLLAAPGPEATLRPVLGRQRQRFQRALRREERLEELLLLDARGKVVLSTHTASEGERREAEPYFAEGLRAPGVHVQAPSLGPAPGPTRSTSIFVVHPVVDQRGTTLGVVAARASLAALNALMLERAGLGESGETYLVSADHVLLTESRFPGHEPGSRYVYSDGAKASVGRHVSGSAVYRDYRGQEVLGVYRWLPALRVALLAERDRVEALRPVFTMLAVNVLVALVAIGIAVALALRITRGIARPLADLARTTARIAAGDLDLTAPVAGAAETRALAQAFNEMTARLRRVIAGLRQSVAELERTSQALRQSEAKYRRIVDTASEGIWVLDPDALTVFVNARMAEMIGRSTEELLGRPMTDFMPEEDAIDQRQRLEQRRRGTSERYERRFLRPDGAAVWTAASATPVFDDEHRYQGSFGMFSDITERKHAEEELRALNQRLEERIAQRTAQLEAVNQELEAFSFTISHELRAPLRAIGGFTEMIAKKCSEHLDAQSRRHLDAVLENARRMGTLISEILDFSRSSRVELLAVEVDMTALAREAFDELRSAAPDRQVELRLGELPSVRGDRALLRQVWLNLVSNALKYTSRCALAVIEVEGHSEGEARAYSVRDNGVGFDPKHADALFEVFYRLHGVEEFEGTGIGLAIVKRVIERHGGRVWAEGQVNSGATFRFTLPARAPHAQAAASGQ